MSETILTLILLCMPVRQPWREPPPTPRIGYGYVGMRIQGRFYELEVWKIDNEGYHVRQRPGAEFIHRPWTREEIIVATQEKEKVRGGE